nr:disaggregatase related repeat-containing protein [Methanosarcina lacustris]
MSSGRYRDVMQFDLSEYAVFGKVSNATLSLYWYYPAENSRPSDTIGMIKI